MAKQNLNQILESLLFVSEQPLSPKRASQIVGDHSEKEVAEAFQALQEQINGMERSFQVVQVAEGFQLVTRPEFHAWAKELYKVISTSRLTKASLEALAIIAYKQPVTRAEVEAIRGVEVSNLVQSLLQKKMIRILGRAETAGRPLLYGTTHEFLIHFGLKDLLDLPKVSEIQELAGDRPSTEFLKGMEGELRRRETKLGLAAAPLEETLEPAGDSAPPVEAASTAEPTPGAEVTPQEDGAAPVGENNQA
ncbi:MAG: SMC-Scp complex subunit ScpB [bacterium]